MISRVEKLFFIICSTFSSDAFMYRYVLTLYGSDIR